MYTISLILILFELYLVTGLIFCVVLLVKGLPTVDPGASKSGLRFKFIIIPGIVLLWPILWAKWKSSSL